MHICPGIDFPIPRTNPASTVERSFVTSFLVIFMLVIAVHLLCDDTFFYLLTKMFWIDTSKEKLFALHFYIKRAAIAPTDTIDSSPSRIFTMKEPSGRQTIAISCSSLPTPRDRSPLGI